VIEGDLFSLWEFACQYRSTARTTPAVKFAFCLAFDCRVPAALPTLSAKLFMTALWGK
jgi:hypothetical protein